jgi:hypothetical protein
MLWSKLCQGVVQIQLPDFVKFRNQHVKILQRGKLHQLCAKKFCLLHLIRQETTKQEQMVRIQKNFREHVQLWRDRSVF